MRMYQDCTKESAALSPASSAKRRTIERICSRWRMLATQLEQDVDERAGLEVLAMKPLVVDVEDREQALLGLLGAAQHLRFDEVARPALFAQIEERDDQIVLG